MKPYYKRQIDNQLLIWKNNPNRKPLLIRGARQVGKSSSVRHLASQFQYYIEIDFEAQKSIHQLFKNDINPKKICEELAIIYNTPVIEGKTLIFFDEIQACTPAIAFLRYFYEKIPTLHVIAAGSLLEFALKELPSFGVGRVQSLFLYPFSFEEFLVARQETFLLNAIKESSFEHAFSEPIHQKLNQLFIRFIMIGGMPEVISTYIQTDSLLSCQNILDDLTTSLYDDFTKYKAKVPSSRLKDVFSSVMLQSGSKFIYSRVQTQANQQQIKESVDLLELAGIIHSVTHTSANGLPLGAETNPKFKKYIPFDTGIFQRFLKLDLGNILLKTNLEQINKGSFVEIFVGLEIIKSMPNNQPQSLFYWQREKQGSQAEVDYLIEVENNIIPIEVKSGIKGKMQSLRQFLSEKKTVYGIRSSLENFGTLPDIKIIPLYALGSFIKKFNNYPLL